MTREAMTLVQVAAFTKLRDLLEPPTYAFVASPADLAAIRGTAPPPLFDPVKPCSTR